MQNSLEQYVLEQEVVRVERIDDPARAPNVKLQIAVSIQIEEGATTADEGVVGSGAGVEEVEILDEHAFGACLCSTLVEEQTRLPDEWRAAAEELMRHHHDVEIAITLDVGGEAEQANLQVFIEGVGETRTAILEETGLGRAAVVEDIA